MKNWRIHVSPRQCLSLVLLLTHAILQIRGHSSSSLPSHTTTVSLIYTTQDAPHNVMTNSNSTNSSILSTCHARGGHQTAPFFVALTECSCTQQKQTLTEPSKFQYDRDDDDNDDDDDDDDDGHSSVLSTPSLAFKIRNTRRISSPSLPTSTHLYSTSTHSCRTMTSKTTSAHSTLLSLRGGAAAAAAASTLSQEYTKQLIVAALVTLLYEAVLGHFLEFLKIVMQTAPPKTTYAQIITRITSQKGIVGIWDGFVPWGVIQAIAKGSVFGFAHAFAITMLTSILPPNTSSLWKQTLAGGIAGGVQGYVLSPTLLLKTRVMTKDIFRQDMSLWKTTTLSLILGWDMIQSEGISSLMKGANIFALKRVLDWATRFFFSDWMEQVLLFYKNDSNHISKLTPGDVFIASMIGGALSTLVTLPLDVIVAKTQDAKKAGVKVSPWQLFIQDYQLGGIKGLYEANMRGFEARLAHVSFTTVVMKAGTRWMYQLLFGPKVS